MSFLRRWFATLQARCGLLLFLLGGLPLAAGAQNLAVYFGGAGLQEIYDIFPIVAPGQAADGTLLIAGGADSLAFLDPAWVPVDRRIELPATALNGDAMRARNSGGVGFLMQVSADWRTVLRFVHFPEGTARTISRIRTTVRTGDPIGELYISGRTFFDGDGFASNTSKYGGALSRPAPRENYFIARLNGNFVQQPPTACIYLHTTTNPYDYRNANDQVQVQPWDVNNLGEVVFGEGGAKIPVFNSSSYLKKLDPFGRLMPVPGWLLHVMKDGRIVFGQNPAGEVEYSAIYGYQGQRGSLRSHTQADFDAMGADSNGNARPGRYPDDFFYRGPVDPVTAAGEPNNIILATHPTTGSTEISGYSAGPGRTGRVADHPRTYAWKAVTFDKRTNDLYVGYELGYYWQAPPNLADKAAWDGRHEFDPTVVAMTPQGYIRAWDRLKQESNGDQPDHYLDALEIDYANNLLTVAGRQHGDGTFTSWRGNQLTANPTARGFKNSLNGTTGNVHISWLGKFRLSDLAVFYATFVAEHKSDVLLDSAYTNPLYDGWTDQNAGWKNMNTTRVAAEAPNAIRVGRDGRVAIVMFGQRVMTTSNAHQKTLKEGDPGTGYFVRVYSPNLADVVYSSMLAGRTSTGRHDTSAELYAVWPLADRVLVAGGHGGNANQIVTADPIGLHWAYTTANTTVSGLVAQLQHDNVSFPGPTDAVTYPTIATAIPPRARIARALRAAPVDEAGAALRFDIHGEAGQRYRLWRRLALGEGDWTAVGDYTTGTGPLSLTDPTPPGAIGFYRIEASPTP